MMNTTLFVIQVLSILSKIISNVVKARDHFIDRRQILLW